MNFTRTESGARATLAVGALEVLVVLVDERPESGVRCLGASKASVKKSEAIPETGSGADRSRRWDEKRAGPSLNDHPINPWRSTSG